MADIHPKLREIIDLYFEAKEKITSIESKSAISAIHLRYVEDVRHALSHILTGLKLEQDASTIGEAEKQYASAYDHLSNLGPDSYQYIAGVMLDRLKKRIEKAGFFGEVGKALNLQSTAIEYYTRARQLRTPNPAQSMELFRKCVSTCQEAVGGIAFPTRKEVVKFWLAVLGGGGVVGILVIILKILKVL